MKIGEQKNSRFFTISFILILLFTQLAYAAEVGYIYSNKARVDKNIVSFFEEMNFTVDLISEKNIPSDLSQYTLIYVGDERYKKPSSIPITKVPSVISNYYFGEEFGLTDSDGISQLASSAPLNVKKGNQVIQVYTQARYNGVSVPYYYLATENKVDDMIRVAGTYTGNNFSLGDVISYSKSGTMLKNHEHADKNICFFGIVESDLWTAEAKELFKDCVRFVAVTCSKDNDCPDSTSGNPYCKENEVFKDTSAYACKNPGTFDSFCKQEQQSDKIKSCPAQCQNGQCFCEDKDSDNFDVCNKYDDGDDGKDKDCNDRDKDINPGQAEVCDNKDNDCDGKIDEGCCNDKDSDNFDDCIIGKPGDDGKDKDCDDNNNNIYPGAPETCDGKDNDCDGQIDENNGNCGDDKICSSGSCVPVVCKQDSDCGSDGYTGNKFCENNDVFQNFVDYECKNPRTAASFCDSSSSKKLIDDCSATEACKNGKCVKDCKDNDNDAFDDCTQDDEDDDGKDKDCDDNNNNIYPGAPETCDGKDNDCDGQIDENNGNCGGGKKCTNGQCVPITCSKNSDCGNDGFIDGTFCERGDIFQNYLTWTCENPGTTSSTCSKDVESTKVTDCPNGCNNGMCTSFVCNKDEDCDDNDEYTKDTCLNPGTANSRCKYDKIKCKKHDDCNDNNQFTKDICNNPGSTDSFCTYEEIVCYENNDCGEDGFINGVFCDGPQNKDVFQNFQSWKCENPGTISSSCTQSITSKLITACSNTCKEGACVNVICNSDQDCNDNNTTTTDKCNNPGTINSFCTHEGVRCSKNADCGTDRFTGDFLCNNKNITRNFLSFECKNPGTAASFCDSSAEAQSLYQCRYACNSGSCIRCNTNNDCDDGKTNTKDRCMFGGTIDSFCLYETVQCEKNSDCGTDGFVGSKVCKDNQVYQKFRMWKCKNPALSGSFCEYDEELRLVETCAYGCDNGICKQQENKTECQDSKDNDNDNLIDSYDPGCWDDISKPETYNPKLDNESRATINCFKDMDCGSDGYVDDSFCKNNSVFQKFKEFDCENPGTGIAKCDSDTEDKLIEACDSDEVCKDGSCQKIICTKDKDCGEDKFIGDTFCQDNNVYQNFKVFSCLNPSQPNSKCATQVDPILVEVCKNGCENGLCKISAKIPSITITSPLNDSVITNEDFTVDFSTKNWVVGGKGEKHVHFHISNVPGLMFSDHLMFYNLDDNNGVVELNFIPGETSYATWIDDNTIRFNDVPDGKHTIRAHLAFENHSAPKNPEAVYEIVVNVKTCTDKDNDGYGKNCDNGDDCDDSDPSINPGILDNNCDGIDNDCDGKTDDGFKNKPVQCGIGECMNSGYIQCMNGKEVNTCAPKNVTNEVCDNKDNNCNGEIDENNGNCDDGKMCSNGQCVSIVCKKNSDCGTDGLFGSKFCQIDDVYQNYKTFKCNNPNTPFSSCSSDSELKLIEECTKGCSDGKCIVKTECMDAVDNDNDNLIDSYDPGCWDDISKPETYNPKLDNESRATINCFKDMDCGSDGYVDDSFCKNNSVFQKFKEFDCENPGTGIAKCDSDTEDKLIEACDSDELCSDGTCKKIKCNKNSDCGNSSFVGEKYCKNDNVYQEFKQFMCNNPGTLSSSCSSDTNSQFFEECAFGCMNGKCIKEDCTDGKDNDGDGKIDGLMELKDNNQSLSINNDPFAIRIFVEQNMTNKKFPGLTIPNKEVIMLAQDASGSGNRWTSCGTPHEQTVTKVCNVFGFKKFTSTDCLWHDGSTNYKYGRGNFHTPEDNYMWRYSGNNFVLESAEKKYEKVWLSSVSCTNKLSACSDGWDNDGDGKIDMGDDGCATQYDDDEKPHDEDC